jgi:DNA-binding transcriptional ArsR family regulator
VAAASTLDAVAQALADPIRREVLRMLSGKSHTVGDLTRAFDVSRPAVSRHLRVLREANLVRDVAVGRHREYQLVLAALDELEAYLQALREPAVDWERAFSALETEVYRVRNRRRAKPAAATTAVTTPRKQNKESA